ncbi:CMRF35-like molecule 5 [Sardina pilchardus]|uniref:CMRF35-like molecule 5 n=1 Tax=Sardina pilchardus TaxID=27697 RepID=UPI002E15228D
MRTALWILSLCSVQTGVLTAPILVFGTEGGRVELTCPYPVEHIFTQKYLCREPCGRSDVLITSGKNGNGERKGRYLTVDTTSANTFSVIISNLRLGDAGVYYCGLNQWGEDTLVKVVLAVSKAPTPVSPPSTTKAPTHLQDTSNTLPTTDAPFPTPLHTVTPTSSSGYGNMNSNTDSVIWMVRFGIILGLLLCAGLTLLWVHKTGLCKITPEVMDGSRQNFQEWKQLQYCATV